MMVLVMVIGTVTAMDAYCLADLYLQNIAFVTWRHDDK
jgi:hypothetical protein